MEQNKKRIYKRVFVIDDTPVDRLIAKAVVKAHDFTDEIILMETAAEMLDYLHETSKDGEGELPQLILLDLNMPNIDGWEFLRQFEEFDRKIKDQFRIFILTSSISIKDKERALTNEYVLDYIVKPLTKEAVFSINARIEQRVRERIRYLSETLEKEKKLNLMKSRFVSLASHEFRTPVSGILSSATLLSKYITAEDQPKRDKHIKNIVTCVNILIDMLNQFLSVGKIAEGKFNTKYSDFNIKDFVERVMMEMQAIAATGQQFSFQHEGPENVHLDSILLRHILINLISNAIKFSPDNSIIEITSHNFDDKLVLSVKDTGLGIPEEDREHLFNLFFRAANVSNIQGTGLGLYIVARYTEVMNGKVEYETQLDKGTEFTISFPQQIHV